MIATSPLEYPDPPYYTIAVLPDTQRYSQDYPCIFKAQIEWIAENSDDEEIELVVHVGDVVNEAVDAQFERADGILQALEKAELPYLVAIGNHDYDRVSERGATTFDRYFPRPRFTESSWWGGAYDDTSHNVFGYFDVGEEKYLIFVLELFPRDEVIEWATEVLCSHTDHPAVIVTHAYLYRDGTPIDMDDQWDRTHYGLPGNNGDELREKLIVRNSNVLVVLCGHVPSEGNSVWTTTRHTDGSPVHQVLSNYQSHEKGGQGYLRLMRFFPSSDVITVETYSPHLDRHYDESSHHFLIDGAFPESR
jgi:hypothetical protein